MLRVKLTHVDERVPVIYWTQHAGILTIVGDTDHSQEIMSIWLFSLCVHEWLKGYVHELSRTGTENSYTTHKRQAGSQQREMNNSKYTHGTLNILLPV